MVIHQIYKVCLGVSQVKHIQCNKKGTYSLQKTLLLLFLWLTAMKSIKNSVCYVEGV